MPLERGTMDLYAYQNGHFKFLDEDLQCLLLCLTASGDHAWLEESLNVPGRWWRKNGAHQALMAELMAALPNTRKRDLIGRTTQHMVIQATIRNTHILLKNDRRALTLVFRAGYGFEILPWFIQELKRDLKDLGDVPEPDVDPEASDDDYEKGQSRMIAEALEVLSKQVKCKKVWYLRSRNEFKVLTKDEERKVFKVFEVRHRHKVRTLETFAPRITAALEATVEWLAETNASTADPEVLEAESAEQAVDPEVGDL